MLHSQKKMWGKKGHKYISKGSVTPKNHTDRKRDVLTKWKILGTVVSLLWSRQPRAVQQLSQDAQRSQAQHPSNCRLFHLNQGHVVSVQDTSQQQKMKAPSVMSQHAIAIFQLLGKSLYGQRNRKRTLLKTGTLLQHGGFSVSVWGPGFHLDAF